MKIRRLVVGNRHVAIRIHGPGPQGFKPRPDVVADLLTAIKERRA